MYRPLNQALKYLLRHRPSFGRAHSERIPILRYRSIDATGSCHSTRLDQLRAHLRYLHERELRAVSLRELFSGRGGDVVLTFDDGFASVAELALPELHRLGFTATFFIAADFVGARPDWLQSDLAQLLAAGNDRIDDPFDAFAARAELDTARVGELLPELLRLRRRDCLRELHLLYGLRAFPLLDWDQIRELAHAGMEIGAHAPDHGALAASDGPALSRGKRAIEDAIQSEVHHLAYPHGPVADFAPELARAAGFAGACTGRRGYGRLDAAHRYRLDRLDMERSSSRLDVDFVVDERNRALLERLWSR